MSELLDKLLDDLETANFDRGVAMAFGNDATEFYKLCESIREEIKIFLKDNKGVPETNRGTSYYQTF